MRCQPAFVLADIGHSHCHVIEQQQGIFSDTHGCVDLASGRIPDKLIVLGDKAARAAYARRTAPPEEVARAAARQIENDARAQERRARLVRNNPMVSRVARVRELLDRGRRAIAEERFADAARDFLTAAALDPSTAEPKVLAEHAQRKASSGKARELWEKARAFELQNELERAQLLAEAAADADPGEARYTVYVARIALQRGALETARLRAEAAVRAAPSLATAHEVLGDVLAVQETMQPPRGRWSARWSWTTD